VQEYVKIGRNYIPGKVVYAAFGVAIGDKCNLQNIVFVYHQADFEEV
jgi:UDP-3-O-[3-hydroxymyristoyl] glucosamine N-acyltransferase